MTNDIAKSEAVAKKLFPGKLQDERVMLYIRRHWIVLCSIIGRLAILAFVPIGIYFILLQTLLISFERFSVSYLLAVFGFSLYYLSILLFSYHDWLDYHLDLWIVTNLRIINIEQRGLFSRVVSEQDIDRVQDVTSEVHGKLATVLNFGNVHIQTAGEQKRFVFEQIANPQNIVKEILRIQHEAKKKM